jgi:hypothetical protein
MNPRFTVIWKRSLIETDLAGFVVRAKERGEDVGAITKAMVLIDRFLASDPEAVGESRADFERVLIVAPLTVTYEVHEEKQIVYVLSVRYVPRRL